MSKSKAENNANIIRLPNSRTTSNRLTSEITRSLFSDTWRNYLDEVYMVAMKINKKGIMKITPDPRSEDATDNSTRPLYTSGE